MANGLLARAEKFAEVWSDAESLSHAHELAKTGINDKREQNRFRRKTESLLGIELPSKTDTGAFWDIECPTTLDIKRARKQKAFVITSCTNDSALITPFFSALERFSAHRSAQLLVVPVRYRNPDAIRSKDDHEWDSAITPYALTKDLHLNKNLVISSHRLNATSVNPLSGKQALSGQKSAIYGHPQLAMELVGTPKDHLPKVMMTTGSCNRPSYSATDAGGKAKFYHTPCAIYVRVVGQWFHFIQLGWDGQGFCYGNEYWTEVGLSDTPARADIVHGDSHVYYEIPKVTESKLRVKELVQPSVQVFHDLHDHHIGSHHATLRERVEQALRKEIFVEDEVRLAPRYLEKLGQGTDNWIAGANHNDHLDKWVERFNPNKDPANAQFYGWLTSKLYGSGMSALEVCFNEWGCGVPYKFLDRNKLYTLHDIDVTQHGDVGVNGARGSAKGFAKTMMKTIIGHSHSPCIEKGCWQVGTSTDRMTYAKGYSTWMLTDCLVYMNGKRALVHHIKGKTIFDFD